MQKLTAGGAGAPDDDFGGIGNFGFVESADEGGHGVAGFRVKIVVGSIEVGGHNRHVSGVVLAVIGLTHFNAGYFGHGIGFIGFFQGAGKQVFFFHGLGTFAGVDAGGTQKQQAADVGLISRLDDIGLNGQVAVNKIGRIGVVGQDAADLGGSHKHIVRLGIFKKGFGIGLAGQVELGMGAGDKVGIAIGLEFAEDGGTGEASVAGDIDF